MAQCDPNRGQWQVIGPCRVTPSAQVRAPSLCDTDTGIIMTHIEFQDIRSLLRWGAIGLVPSRERIHHALDTLRSHEDLGPVRQALMGLEQAQWTVSVNDLKQAQHCLDVYYEAEESRDQERPNG